MARSCRIRARLGFAGYEVRSRAYLDTRTCFLGYKSYSTAGGGHLDAKMDPRIANLRLARRLALARKVAESGLDSAL